MVQRVPVKRHWFYMSFESTEKGGVCAFVDAEHALDPAYAKKLGVDIDELVISQPGCREQALEIADTLVRSGAIDVLVVDSVVALVAGELEGEWDTTWVSQARLMSKLEKVNFINF